MSSARASWSAVDAALLGGIDVTAIGSHDTATLVSAVTDLARGESFLAWTRYQIAYVLHERLVLAREDTDGFVIDGFADCAARIAKSLAMPRHRGEAILNTAIGIHAFPQVAECLRDGIISDAQVQLIATRTGLLGDAALSTPDSPIADRAAEVARLTAAVDADIAAVLRGKKGVWSRPRLRDMVDRIVFRHDPDSVRERRRRALDERGLWVEQREDGTAEIAALMSAENVRIAVAAVRGLAGAVCPSDPRTRQQRASDAMFALLTGTAFECACGDERCNAQIPETSTAIGASIDTKVVIHVVCDEATLADTGGSDDAAATTSAPNVGWMDRHGVISDEHVRDLAARPDSVIKPLIPRGTPENADGTFTLPATQPADPYRPSAALDEFIRVRDGICVDPGCEQSAWDADADHVAEYDHSNPTAGGQTTPDNLNSKCRGDHLIKTHGGWVDDQYRDEDGQLRTEYITPEGVVLDGEAETLEDFFPGLRRIRFAPTVSTPNPSRPPPPPPPPPPQNPRRRRTRTADKHARRRAERRRNQECRHQQSRIQQSESRITTTYSDGPPPF